MEKQQSSSTGQGFKLNYKRTLIIGFAFFGILLLWQVYDSWCTPFLTELFKNKMYPDIATITDKDVIHAAELKVQYLVGLVMAIDNLAALILLPIFGVLSDKTNTKIGKRMPYILIGTLACVIAFPFIPLLFLQSNLGGVIVLMALVSIFAMMYRNPAVALMPDMTPKPLRSRANGLINIMGYIGGAFAVVLGFFFDFKKTYLNVENPADRNPFNVVAPFIIASVLLLISAIVLFITVRENKIRDEMKDEMARGDKVSETVEAVDDDKPISKANKIMLILILVAEFFWFMADNAVGTFLNNYILYGTTGTQASTSTLTLVGGVGSVAGFALGGLIASKIGRKHTLLSGLGITLVAYVAWVILVLTLKQHGGDTPMWLIPIYLIKGFGMSLVHVNSFPMVVELCNSKKIGKFTGYYYAASMVAQTVTPAAFGALLLIPSFDWHVLPIYAASCTLVSALVFIFVKNVKSKKTTFQSGIEGIGLDGGD